MKNDKILIKNAKSIITCDSNDSILKDADILIEGPQIKAIGKNINSSNTHVINAENMFVYPGLINTHHHFFQAFVRNNPGLDFVNMDVIQWLDIVYKLFVLIDEDSIYHTTMIGMADLLKHGCTTAFDHQYCFTSHAGPNLIDRQMEVAEKLGIRFHAGRGTNTLPASEGSVIPDKMRETTDVFLTDCNRVVEKYHNYDKFAMKRIVIAPCNVSQSTKDTFVEALKLARQKNIFLHTHLGEGENRLMLERYGCRSLNWCEDIGFIGPDVWFAHGWEFTNEEIDILAKTNTGLSHCPAPVVLGHFDVIDIPRMMAKGVRLGLGVDGYASNDGGNMLELPRLTYQLQNLSSDKRNYHIPTAYECLKFATSGGAKLLGRDDIGSLEVGKAADMFMIDVNKLEYLGALHCPESFLARVGWSGPVSSTMVNGKIVFENGNLVGCEESKEIEKASKCLSKLIYGSDIYKKYSNVLHDKHKR